MKSLQFASGGYIHFVPDWSPLVSAFSVCGWVKETGTNAYPSFFHYYASGHEIMMQADGNHMHIQGVGNNWASSASISRNTWYHQCVTWSASSREFRYYVNTRLVGTRTTTSGRLMKTGGDITIGKHRGHSSSNNMFTGEIAYLNVYAKELTSAEITKIVRAGMCTNLAYPDPHESYREIKWENIVQIARVGSVTDVYQEDCITYMYNSLAKLKAAKGVHNETSEQLDEVLEEKVALETRLNSTLVELEKISENLNRTWDWDVFLAQPFINQTFSANHSELLHSTWDGIAGNIYIRIPVSHLSFCDPKNIKPKCFMSIKGYDYSLDGTLSF